ncbi:MAG: hypothetical protein MMC33_007555 [Icmadophila ericetorum]|nr:hypothetical protein [Icmadophila ericetorum]
MVMEYAPDISFLINLGIADPSIEFELQRIWGTLLPMTLAYSIPREMQQLAYTVLAIHHSDKDLDQKFESDLLSELCFNELRQPLAIETAIANPMCWGAFNKLKKNIDFFTETFADRLCEIPAPPSACRKARRTRPAPLSPLSCTERYRIQRALWRFQICCELSHSWAGGIFVAPELLSQVALEHIQHPYLLTLNYWELEELCCVYNHLESLLGRDLSTLHLGNTVIDPLAIWNTRMRSCLDTRYQINAKAAKAKLLSRGLPFLQQYFELFTLEQRISTEQKMDGYEDGFIMPSLYEVINRCRPEWKMERNSLSCSTGYWPDAPNGADCANTGWNYFIQDPSSTYTLDHMRRFGLCLWDAKRLKNWRRLIWQKCFHQWSRAGGWDRTGQKPDVELVERSCAQM